MTDQFISDDGDLRHYRMELPNMADDELDPYEFRLYAHYKRVCGGGEGGACWETVRTTADKTRMSVGQVVETRNRLATSGWITIHQADDSSHLIITIVNRWPENFQRYTPAVVHPMNPCSPDEQPIEDCSPGERHLKKNSELQEETQEEETDSLPPVFDGYTSSPEDDPPPEAGGDGQVTIQGVTISAEVARMEPGELLAQEGYTLTRTLADTLDDWLQDHPPEEVNAAIVAASMQNVRKPSYVNRILERWREARSPAAAQDVNRFKRSVWEVDH